MALGVGFVRMTVLRGSNRVRSGIALVVLLSTMIVGCGSRRAEPSPPVLPAPASSMASPGLADASLADAASADEHKAAEPEIAAPAAPPASASEWAQRWLDALRARDAKALRSLSSYPFRFDDTNAVRGCQSGAATQASELEAAITCLFTDELLTGALQANLELGYEPTKPARLPKWAKRWRKDIAATSSVIATQMGDNGISYFFLIVVAKDGVQAVYRHAEFWPN